MIKLNKISDDFIQVLGSVDRTSVRGAAFKAKVPGNSSTVWQYNLRFLQGQFLCKQESNPKEGTLTTEDLLRARIERECLEFQELTSKMRGGNQ